MFKTAIESAIEAGKEILKVYNSDNLGIVEKSDRSPLTLADQKAHDVIIRRLSATNLPILSEEGKEIPNEKRKNWSTFWMVDPLDGTKEFIKKNGEFSVNIALIENGIPTFGIVYVPVHDKLFVGGKDVKPYLIDNGNKKNLNKKNKPTTLIDLKAKDHIRIVASRSHLNSETKTFLEQLQSPQIVSMGSSLKFMAIIEGEADLYPRFAPTMEWDTAASHAILNALDYQIFQLNTIKELIYNKENLLNPYFICY